MNFSVMDVITVSCAVHRTTGGFVKKGYGNENQKSNSAYLYEHFCEGKTVDVIDADREEAQAVMDYLQGLGFKALERNLTEFEKKVLEFVVAETVDKSKLGIAASLPNVYQSKQKSDIWADRERELGVTSDFIGQENTRCTFTATIEFLRFIPSTNSFMITSSVDNKNILKFFKVDDGVLPIVGKTYNIAGYVKPYRENKYTGFKETMINRVKFDLTE